MTNTLLLHAVTVDDSEGTPKGTGGIDTSSMDDPPEM